uniref:Rieske domain-containing protein n=1 Tax=Panagrellus redivivus TaxID=6233 RepID=A0A7E4ZZ44_PANRE
MVKSGIVSKRQKGKSESPDDRSYGYHKRKVKKEMGGGLLRRSVRFMVKPDKNWNGFVNPPVMKSERHYYNVAAPVPDGVLTDDPLSDAYPERESPMEDPMLELELEPPPVGTISGADEIVGLYFDDIPEEDDFSRDTSVMAGASGNTTAAGSVCGDAPMMAFDSHDITPAMGSDSDDTTSTDATDVPGTSYTVEGLLAEVATERAGRLEAEAKVAALTAQLAEQAGQQKTIKTLQSKIDEMARTIEDLRGPPRVTRTSPTEVKPTSIRVKTEPINIKLEPTPPLPYPRPKSGKIGPRNVGNETKIPVFYVGLTQGMKARIPYYYEDNGLIRKFHGLHKCATHVGFNCAGCHVPARIVNDEFYLCKPHLPRCKGVPSDVFAYDQLNRRHLYVEGRDDKEIFNFCNLDRLYADQNVISDVF